MANEHTQFWLKLLQFGKNEQERQCNWNLFCIHMLRVNKHQLVHGKGNEILTKLNIGKVIDKRQLDPFRKLAEENGGPLSLPEPGPGPVLESFMDFSDTEISKDISFAGRILIGIDFRAVEFEHDANFSDSIFLGLSHFDGAKFRFVPKDGITDGISFINSEFHNTIYFNSTEFMSRTRFDGAVFHVGTYFREARFEPEETSEGCRSGLAGFAGCRFENQTEFTKARFEVGVDFRNSEFNGITKFDKSSICKRSNFNNAKFRNATSFSNMVFGYPPRFFETELHEDTDFSDTDWSRAEDPYSSPSGGDSVPIKRHAADAVRAWDRLTLIMSQREKLAERHEFFSLKMRANVKAMAGVYQRWQIGCSISSRIMVGALPGPSLGGLLIYSSERYRCLSPLSLPLLTSKSGDSCY